MGIMAISNLIVLGGIYLIVALIWWLLQIAANWRIFTKAGEDGWKSIIPVYSDYISYKIAWQPSYFWLTLILGIVASVISAATTGGGDGTNTTILLVISLLRLIMGIISILYSFKLAKAFGRGTGFALGLIFLQPIFLLILGFGNDSYYGPEK